MKELIKQIEKEFVGLWKYHPRTGLVEWCATVVVDGAMFDTDNYPTIEEALNEAIDIVKEKQ